MGVKGKRRINKKLNEPTLLGNIQDIIAEAREKGYINGYKVNIEAIIRENNIVLKKEVLDSEVSGYLSKRSGEWEIVVNSNHHPKRQRFTMAHEFAHYCLHKEEDELFEDTTFFRITNDSPHEYHANEFAAQLLIPEELFEDAINNGINSVRNLAEEFEVSVMVVKLRANFLEYNIS